MKTILSNAMRHGLLLVLLAIALVPAVSRGQQTSQYMSYQGYLTDGNGNALGGTNTGPKAYDVVFRIWDAGTGGNELFSELQTVTVDNGNFSVLLGQGTAYSVEPTLHVLLASVFTNSGALSRYIEITVLGIGVNNYITILPRLQLVSSPFAFQAANALNVTGANVITAANLATNLGVWQTSGTNVYHTSGSVGINTSAPGSALDVNGNIQLDGGHLIYNSPSSTIDWGNGSLFFRSDTTQGNVGAYTTPMTLTAGGNLTVSGTVTAGGFSGVPSLSGANTFANTSSQTYGSDFYPAGGFNYYGSMNMYSTFGPGIGAALIMYDSPSYSGDNGGLYYCMLGPCCAYASSDAVARDMVLRNANGKLLIQSGTGASAICVAANNNVGIHNTSPTTLLQVGSATCNGATWANASDRNLKGGFTPVSPAEMLAKVVSMPVESWYYTSQPGEKHIGPVAQDFHAAFGLNGSDDKHITTVDENGVALAAIQGLNQKVENLEAHEAHLAELEQKAARVTALEEEVADLKKMIAKLAGEGAAEAADASPHHQ
ncbi:MAG TPA: tail fiber domain-containing protein [Candidatus Saccharimonadales bacterium]|nr:tail fiber domain-containing protein [Candidatus Saccharimonadales bacterium]